MVRVTALRLCFVTICSVSTKWMRSLLFKVLLHSQATMFTFISKTLLSYEVNVFLCSFQTGTSSIDMTLGGQKVDKTFISTYLDMQSDFTLKIRWCVSQQQIDCLNCFKGCLWRQKHWWQLIFITSLKPFQIGVWNSGFASCPCRTCTQANFRKNKIKLKSPVWRISRWIIPIQFQ